jgi:predicted acyltransferase
MILGLIAGGWLRRDAPTWQKIVWLIATGVVLLGLGWAAHFTGICPSVKRIWTPSWTLFSGGWCFLFLAAFYAVIDVAKFSAWGYPLRVIGANSIAAYLLAHGSEAFLIRSFHIHFGKEIFQIGGSAYEPLIAGMVVLAIQWLILWWMYRNRIYIRI